MVPPTTKRVWINVAEDVELLHRLPLAWDRAEEVLRRGGLVLGHCLRSKRRMAAFYCGLMVQ